MVVPNGGTTHTDSGKEPTMQKAFIAAQTRWMELKDRKAELESTDEGATMVEYALIVAGIAIVLLVAIGVFSGALGNLFNRQSNTLNSK
jgi:Flp pilus assembly pilin Flp